MTELTAHDPSIDLSFDPSFIAELPKADLHVHVEGLLDPELALTLARRHGAEKVDEIFANIETLRAAYAFQGRAGLASLWARAVELLRTASDFHDATWAYLQRAHGGGVRHVEIAFSPHSHTRRGVAFATVVDGMWRALKRGQRELGMSGLLIAYLGRPVGAPSAGASADDSADDNDNGLRDAIRDALAYHQRIAALDIDARDLPRALAILNDLDASRQARFSIVVHAPADCPVAAVGEALAHTPVARVGFDHRILDDDYLLDRLARNGIPITTTPLSDLRRDVIDGIRSFPLRQMRQRGLLTTINSDAPGYFGGDLSDNYRELQEALELVETDLYVLARHSFTASFLDAETRQAQLNLVDGFAAQRGLTLVL